MVGSFAESNNNQTDLSAEVLRRRAAKKGRSASGRRSVGVSGRGWCWPRTPRSARLDSNIHSAWTRRIQSTAHFANRLHFGVLDQSDDYLPSAKAGLTHSQPSQANAFQRLVLFHEGRSRL